MAESLLQKQIQQQKQKDDELKFQERFQLLAMDNCEMIKKPLELGNITKFHHDEMSQISKMIRLAKGDTSIVQLAKNQQYDEQLEDEKKTR